METEGSFLHLHVPATCPFSESVASKMQQSPVQLSTVAHSTVLWWNVQSQDIGFLLFSILSAFNYFSWNNMNRIPVFFVYFST